MLILIKSDPGKAWYSSATAPTGSCKCGTYFKGLHMVAGYDTLGVSPDLVNWTSKSVTIYPANKWAQTADHACVAGWYHYGSSSYGRIYRTTDGNTFTSVYYGDGFVGQDLIYDNGKYFMWSSGSLAGQYSNADGTSWSPTSLISGGFDGGGCWDGTYYWGAYDYSSNTRIYRVEADFSSRTYVKNLSSGYPRSLNYLNGYYVCTVGAVLYYTTDPTGTWESRTLVTGSRDISGTFFHDEVRINGKPTYFAYTSGNTSYPAELLYSYDLSTWTTILSKDGASHDFFDAYACGDALIVVDYPNTLHRLVF